MHQRLHRDTRKCESNMRAYISRYHTHTGFVRSAAMRSAFVYTIRMEWNSIKPTIGLNIATILSVNKEWRSDSLQYVLIPWEVKTSVHFKQNELCSIVRCWKLIQEHLTPSTERFFKGSWQNQQDSAVPYVKVHFAVRFYAEINVMEWPPRSTDKNHL